MLSRIVVHIYHISDEVKKQKIWDNYVTITGKYGLIWANGRMMIKQKNIKTKKKQPSNLWFVVRHHGAPIWDDATWPPFGW